VKIYSGKTSGDDAVAIFSDNSDLAMKRFRVGEWLFDRFCWSWICCGPEKVYIVRIKDANAPLWKVYKATRNKGHANLVFESREEFATWLVAMWRLNREGRFVKDDI